MALATADIHVKVDPKVKKESEKNLKEFGLTMSDLINITLRGFNREKRIPFDATIRRDLPENLRIETEEQLVEFLERREEYNREHPESYTSSQMRDILSERLGVSV